MVPLTLPNEYILRLDSPLADLARVGGKGTNLSILKRSGLPVPDGFHVMTGAYRTFVANSGLSAEIDTALAKAVATDSESLEEASECIRAAFARGSVPEAIRQEITTGWGELGAQAVAVRSSATAEDLPDLSFAGQQDTYLNVVGHEALLKAVLNCWSSLWTARAIGYRQRNNISHHDVALAVIVQVMIPSEVAGVLFTANPLTGRRAEIVIDAAPGLGEGLVSGLVEPDHYIVDPGKDRVTGKTAGQKAVSIRGRAGGGTEKVIEPAGQNQALTDEQILRLARLGGRVAELYGGEPQDIEWALAGDTFFILQSRPITSLYPTPAGLPADPLQFLLSFGAIQGMLDPITPLGRDLMKLLIAMGANMALRRPSALATQHMLFDAGERLWVNITPIVRSSLGRRLLGAGTTLVEPSILEALRQVREDPLLQPEQKGIRPRTVLLLASFIAPIAGNMVLNMLRPAQRREFIMGSTERAFMMLREKAAALHGSPLEKLRWSLNVLPELAFTELLSLFRLLISAIASGLMSLTLLNNLTRGLVQDPSTGAAWHPQALAITRSLPHNPTTEMGLALWDTARAIRADRESASVFASQESPALAQNYLEGRLPPVAQATIKIFLDRYGGRGLAEIDAGRERWADDPTHVIESLIGYLRLDDAHAPDVVFRQGAEEARLAQQELERLARNSRPGWLKARLVHFFAGRARELMSLREVPKFFIVRVLTLIRASMLESGRELRDLGLLDQPDDLFFLTLTELRSLADSASRDWRPLIAERRARFNREKMRRQIPRVLLSDGRAFYDGIASSGGKNALNGSPVSPGTAEGLVRVVLDPRQAGLQPGEILVCPGTDPSWTPLFLVASGLVMEVGGMMTHGAVVAREYGIPAIVGVASATQRLTTGQHIRIDGTTGQIQLLE